MFADGSRLWLADEGAAELIALDPGYPTVWRREHPVRAVARHAAFAPDGLTAAAFDACGGCGRVVVFDLD